MHMFDASYAILAWDNYPLTRFRRLEIWLGSQVGAQLLTLSEIAYEEVCLRAPDCGSWLKSQKEVQKCICII